ncbi:MAG: SDR family oxidoreductase [Nitrospiraceae bacterium]|jgi:dTDP-4-dehydrorhamnose reductase|uniref:SDR family oxidoreductase n=1 Tax=Nitrospira cf. moscoviensis SBR1015 TaxID=96242 RepID=UPI000A0DF258|nr:SDR family oxidoreductase [Nitrospira cf. moscoviensis SBR1015]MBY0249725.1 SDR family oxidoreductase [Nitrospiraceae bacterium]OQW37205.1 MAG: NAD(P)-dependent oxidoreductase [Nitrospira sp. SG-bin2]
MMPRAVVTGAAGLIGQYVMKSAARWAPGWEVHGLTRADLDLTDQDAVERTWQLIDPHAVIHCAALSRTKDCEQNPEQARRINVEATAQLARLSNDIPFIFLSSGEVFDGRHSWYREEDAPNPINVYGKTKIEAEQLVLENPRHTVLRIVLTAGASLHGNRSFVEDMCRTAKSGKSMTLYGDEFRCPLPAGVIARAVWEIAGQAVPGLYHLGGRERLSRWDIGRALLPWYPELQGRLLEGSARSHAGAPRPADLSLNCEKIQTVLSFPIPGFRSWLERRMHRDTDLWDYDAGVP